MKVNHRSKTKPKAPKRRNTTRRARKLEDGWRSLATAAIEELRELAIRHDDTEGKRLASMFTRRLAQLAGQLEMFT